MSVLVSLDLSSNQLGLDGAEAVAQALRGASGGGLPSTLKTLVLDGNNLGDAGTSTIAESALHSEALETLSLAGCGFGPDGARSIAQTLKHDATIRRLVLSSNAVADAGGLALGEGLRHNRHLNMIELSGCEIQTKGLKAIGRALATNRALTNITITNNDLSEEDMHVLGSALLRNDHAQLSFIVSAAEPPHTVLRSPRVSCSVHPHASPTASCACYAGVRDVRRLGGAERARSHLRPGLVRLRDGALGCTQVEPRADAAHLEPQRDHRQGGRRPRPRPQAQQGAPAARALRVRHQGRRRARQSHRAVHRPRCVQCTVQR